MEKIIITEENPNCIGCGQKNPIGLKLKFDMNNGVARTKSSLSRNYEGYKNIIHGGIISLILDETSAKAVFSKKLIGVTGKITVKFFKPLYVNDKFECEAKVNRVDGRRIFVEAKLSVNGEIKATSESLFVKMGEIDE